MGVLTTIQLCGALLCVTAWVLVPLRLESAILLLAVAVLVPLGVQTIPPAPVRRKAHSSHDGSEPVLDDSPSRPPLDSKSRQAAVPLVLPSREAALDAAEATARRVIQAASLPSAALLAVAYWLQPGIVAALCAAVWLLVTLIMAGWGLLRLVDQRRSVADWTTSAALTFPVIGGGWTVLLHLGWWPLSFDPVIVELTGVHFHFAGFALPLILAWQLRKRPGRILVAAAILVLASIPALALGITYWPLLELLAAAALVLACVAVAATQLRFATQSREATSLLMLAVSGLSLLGGMALALLYAVTEFRQARFPEIPVMVALHGTLNAFGFALCGLLAAKRARPLDDSEGKSSCRAARETVQQELRP